MKQPETTICPPALWIFDDTLQMIGDNVTVYAEFLPITPAKAPRIDENGEYHPGNVAYCEIADGYYCAVRNGRVGERLDSVEVSDFEFELIDSGAYHNTYQINHYTGSIDELTELVIPKSYNRKKIRVLGDNVNPVIISSDTRHQFILTLNQNIRVISRKAFCETGVTKVQGETSGLQEFGINALNTGQRRRLSGRCSITADIRRYTLSERGIIKNQPSASSLFCSVPCSPHFALQPEDRTTTARANPPIPQKRFARYRKQRENAASLSARRSPMANLTPLSERVSF